MNDKLKFRAWYEGRYIYKDLCNSNYYTEDGKCIGLANTLPNDLPWEQCTGLKDKNGKLIYEGDILKDIYGVLKIVYWDEQYSSLRVKYQDNTHCGIIWQQYVDVYEMEVIGNIHENQEL